MRLAYGAIHEVTEEKLVFAKQFGATDLVVHTPPLPGDGYWEFTPLLMLRTRVESAGLNLAAIENIPHTWYLKAMLGQPGRDEEIENFCRTLENMGRAGIPILGYHFCPTGVWRTCTDTPWRGGARVSSFDYRLARNAPVTSMGRLNDRQMWDNFTYFLKNVIPSTYLARALVGLVV